MFNRNKAPEGAGEAASPSAGPGRGIPGEPPIAKPQRPDIPGFQRMPDSTPKKSAGEPEGSKLIVGRDIHLKGEITSCDVLVVEGKVEASMNSRHLGIADSGVFQGDCEIDSADISGRFDGNLVARKRLVIRSTGQVSGTIRYGEIEIEAGGTISGDVQMIEGAAEAKRQTAGPKTRPAAGDSRPDVRAASSAAE